MKLKPQYLFWGIVIFTLVLGCNIATPPPENPAGDRLSGNALNLLGEEIPDPEVTPIPPTPTLAPSSTPEPTKAPTDTPVPTETPLPTPTSIPTPAFIACCRGNHVYQLTENGPERIDLTISIGNFYDFHPDTGRVLYGSAFPNRGWGPANKAVTDLYILDVATGETTVVFPEDFTVSARWSPNGEDFAYLLATQETYELRVRLASGEDRLLATDVYLDYEFNPAGTELAFRRRISQDFGIDSSLHTVSIETGMEEKIGEVDKSGGGSIDDRIIWWPDGSAFSIPFISSTAGDGVAYISLDGTVAPMIMTEQAIAAEPVSDVFDLWHPDGNKIIGFSLIEGPYDLEEEFIPHIALFELDESRQAIIGRTVLQEGLPAGGPFIWHISGESFWTFLVSETPGEPPVPQLITLPDS